MGRVSWESLCHQCGLCCHEKTLFNDIVVIHTDKPCEFLDVATMQCTCYNDRFVTNPRCLKVTPFRAMFSPLLPPSCGYVQYMKKRRLRWVRKDVICENNH